MADPINPNQTLTNPVSALAAPDLTKKYEDAASAITTPPAQALTAGYQSPFTTDQTTGELAGQPQVKESESYITPQTTVAGQLETLMKTESPLMKLSETQAKERASALGMSSSSMAVGAAQKALFETALPIAQQDAQQAFQLKQQEQAIENEQTKIETEAQVAGQLNLQKAQLAEQQSRLQAGWETTIKGLDQQSQVEMAGYQAELNKNIKELETNMQAQLQKQNIDAQIQGVLVNQAQDMLNNYQVTIQQLLGNQAFLESMPSNEAMRGVFNDMFQTVSSSIRYSTKAAGVYNPTMETAINEMVAANLW